jgi:hypothetical protein
MLSKESDDQELAEYYQPFKLIFDSRLQETKNLTQGG